MKKVLIWLVILAGVCIAMEIRDSKIIQPTYDDCVAYWLHRTSTWDNPPNAYTIANDPTFCGNFAK